MRLLGRLMRWIIVALIVAPTATLAATCSPATSGGTAPSSWPTYCWLDLSTYSDATARSAAGQNFSYSLTDGSTLSFNLKVSQTGATTTPYLKAVAAPSYSGAAVGNTAFLGIPGQPVMYTANNATVVTAVFSNIAIAPPSGVAAASSYAFVAADAESSNQSEALSFTTNGGAWTIVDQVPPISGNLYPTISSTGTTFGVTGVAGTVGGYIIASNSPTTVTAVLTAGGLQGVMFAVRFASVQLNKTLVSVRPNSTDQFTYSITATSSGATLATKTSTGTGNGPYGAIGVSLASGLPFTVKEVMASGSTSTLAAYSPSLTCTNGTSGSSTTMPTNAAVSSYSFPTLQFGDAITCMFTNTPYPLISVKKALGSSGRVFTADQFTMSVRNSSGTTVATTTTTGTGATVNNSQTTPIQATVGQAYSFAEAASGTTILTDYSATMSCANAFTTSSTTLPTTVRGSVTPALGDSIICTITNTAIGTTATLQIQKTSTVVSDPVNGTTNPKAIPGAVVQYTITVTNIGTGPVDSGTVIVTDPLPTTVSMYVAGASPVTFTDGTPSSGLTMTSTNVTYTKATGGGTPFTYTPVANGSGYDANVTGIRIAPQGIMNAATPAGQLPNFSVTFKATIK